MKRFIVFSLVFTLLCLSSSSCKKCYQCDFGNNDVRTFCPKDFPDKASGLKLTIDGYKERGYKCTAK